MSSVACDLELDPAREVKTLINKGWPLFPLKPQSKIPAVEDWPNRATTDRETLREWYRADPTRNWAIATGSRLGLLVLDIDPGKGGDEALADLEAACGRIPETVEIATGGGGRHIYFRHPGGYVKSVNGVLGPGLDVKADGGYVVAPGSVHPETGRTYEWELSSHPNETPLAEPPEWLLDHLASPQSSVRDAESGSGIDPETVLDGVPEGQRDDTLFRYACRLRAQNRTRKEAETLVLEAARNCNPQFPKEQALKKVESAWRYEPGTSAESEADNRPTIEVTGGALPRLVDQADHLLAQDHAVYQRGTRLVRLARAGKPKKHQKIQRPAGTPMLVEPGPGWVRQELTRRGKWLRYNEKQKGWVEIDAPKDVAATYLESAGEWTAPVLTRVAECPTLREDGSLLITSGYDSESGILAIHNLNPTVEESPEAAQRALADLRELLAGFPFVDDVDESVALSAILTAIIRAILATSPLFAFSAREAGSGKSLLADLLAALATGRNASTLAVGTQPEEFEKRLGSALLAGDACIALDNIERPLSSELLCQILTQEQVAIRILGKSEMPTLPTNALVTATGNNLRLAGDMTRRGLLC